MLVTSLTPAEYVIASECGIPKEARREQPLSWLFCFPWIHARYEVIIEF
jgi:hypothetical protein